MTMDEIIRRALTESAELRNLWAEWLHMQMDQDDEPDAAA